MGALWQSISCQLSAEDCSSLRSLSVHLRENVVLGKRKVLSYQRCSFPLSRYFCKPSVMLKAHLLLYQRITRSIGGRIGPLVGLTIAQFRRYLTQGENDEIGIAHL